MAGITQRSVCSGVTFRGIRDDRYKTVLMSINFFLPLDRKTVSSNAILPFLLKRASRKYPDFTKLNEHLAELYGAVLDADVQRWGDAQILSVSASAIADRYALDGERVSAELSSLLCSVCFDPPLQDGLFPEDGFLQEKRQLEETLDAEFNNKVGYALRRCEEIMCADEPYGIGRLGSKKEIADLRRENLTAAWGYMIRHARVEIFVLGDCDPEPAFREFSDAFHSLGRTSFELCPTVVKKMAGKKKDVTERMNVAQSKLVIGFRTGCAEPEKGAPAVKLMNALYGGMPTSKLFLNVREKMGLCYYCAPAYNSVKGILEVQSGVEKKNLKRAEEEILSQLEEIRSGNFTDEEVTEAKCYLSNIYHTFSDSLEAMENWYLVKTMYAPTRTPEEEADMVNAVTREEIVEAAQHMTLDTVYRLTGNEVKN